MVFLFRADVSIPGTVNGVFRVKAVLGMRRRLGEDAEGLTDKQVAEEYFRRVVIQAYNYEDTVSDGAAETAVDVVAIGICRADISTREANIRALRLARQMQSEFDWNPDNKV